MKTVMALAALALIAAPALAHIAVPVGEDIYYLPDPTNSADSGVWKEANPCEGLQETISDCLDNGEDADGNPILEPADEPVL